MKKRSLLIATLILVLGVLSVSAVINASSSSFKSNGIFIYDNNTSDTSDDVIIDASDFEKLATVCQ